MIIAIDPILDALVAVGLWWALRRPDPTINVHVESPVPSVSSQGSQSSPDQNRVAVLHQQPDGTWQEIGHAEFESRENPGERIVRELATPGRAIRWPDGSIQES